MAVDSLVSDGFSPMQLCFQCCGQNVVVTHDGEEFIIMLNNSQVDASDIRYQPMLQVLSRFREMLLQGFPGNMVLSADASLPKRSRLGSEVSTRDEAVATVPMLPMELSFNNSDVDVAVSYSDGKYKIRLVNFDVEDETPLHKSMSGFMRVLHSYLQQESTRILHVKSPRFVSSSADVASSSGFSGHKSIIRRGGSGSRFWTVPVGGIDLEKEELLVFDTWPRREEKRAGAKRTREDARKDVDTGFGLRV